MRFRSILLIVGLDIIPLTIDWSQITGFLRSPLMTPFWAIGNIFVAFAFWIWIITPILHFTNTWYGNYMPISTSVSYDNTGQNYNVTKILNDQFEFDLSKYKAYSPLFLGTTFALAYGLTFASLTALLVHAYLFHGSQVWQQWKESLDQEEDIHMKLNRVYKEAPDWWYIALGVGTFAMALATCEGWDTKMVFHSLFLLIIALVGFDSINCDCLNILHSCRDYRSHLKLSTGAQRYRRIHRSIRASR